MPPSSLRRAGRIGARRPGPGAERAGASCAIVGNVPARRHPFLTAMSCGRGDREEGDEPCDGRGRHRHDVGQGAWRSTTTAPCWRARASPTTWSCRRPIASSTTPTRPGGRGCCRRSRTSSPGWRRAARRSAARDHGGERGRHGAVAVRRRRLGRPPSRPGCSTATAGPPPAGGLDPSQSGELLGLPALVRRRSARRRRLLAGPGGRQPRARAARA